MRNDFRRSRRAWNGCAFDTKRCSTVAARMIMMLNYHEGVVAWLRADGARRVEILD